MEETTHEDFHPAFRSGRRRAVGHASRGHRAAADRHQVQPCRGARHAEGLAAEFFAKRAAELTKGKVKVEVYANSTLYKDKEEMEALQLGAVQMLAPSLAKFGPLGVKEFELFDLPYIFDNYEELHKVTQGPVGQSLLKKLEPKGSSAWRSGTTASSRSRPTRRSRCRPT
jgi:TRAP-type C4-dicarboxylate transport system substrate-binding protein